MAKGPATGSKLIETSLFKFIWKYSKGQQIALLLVTVALFPFLYLTLELPKRIINDAIGASQSTVPVMGYELSQTTFLFLLCGLFLLAVFAHGILKMRINTMKGVLAERMLRRLRYQLVTRLVRFPKPYFQRTSQAEIVSMVTAEAEPLGGMMGDAISQPIMQAGQMLTILGFLFLQSFWFGLAAVSMIPAQAWLIPKLQRQVNALNKKRLAEVRRLAAEIGETAAGSIALRTAGGYRFRAAQITHQLGRLFFIRLEIYKKKFFMKFLNNFLTQLTPFFFFSIGGYLVIRGNVSIGALVAALAAYKDLSSPWKELLTFYTRAHEMAQRWTLVTERFAPNGAVDEALVNNPPEILERLDGDIVFDEVSALDTDGVAVVSDLSMTLPAGGLIGIAAKGEEDRRALAELLTRELLPTQGRITVGGRDLSRIHQAEIGARVGWIDPAPYLFAGTIRDNLFLGLKTRPRPSDDADTDLSNARLEAERSGNSVHLKDDDWIDPGLAGFEHFDDINNWWLQLVEAMGADRDVLRRGLSLHTNPDLSPDLTRGIVARRTEVRETLATSALEDAAVPFDRDAFNPAATLMDNLLFAVPKRRLSQGDLANHPEFLSMLRKTGLEQDLFAVACSVVETLYATFGSDSTDHPLFQRLNIDPKDYQRSLKASKDGQASGVAAVPDADLATLLALPCLVRPGYIGHFVPDDVQGRVIEARKTHADEMAKSFADLYDPLDADRWIDGLNLLENAIFGLPEKGTGQRAEELEDTVIGTLIDGGLKIDIATLALGEETTLAGANLPRAVTERIGFTRAAIKRPDIFVLDRALASYTAEHRRRALLRLRKELPSATIVVLESAIEHPEDFDTILELDKGRLSQGTLAKPQEDVDMTEPDLATKLQVLEQTDFFANLDRKQMRLLAFSAQWFEKSAGDVVFRKGDDAADGAYLILKGEADFIAPLPDGGEQHIRTLGPGSLVGELALILGEPRTLSMKARTDMGGLRIGGEEFLAVVQNDPQTAFTMLQSVTRYLSKVPG